MNPTELTRLITPVVVPHGLEVDRIEIAAAGRRSMVRVFLDGDGPSGRGPSLDQIAEATRSISAALDEVDITKGRPYTLEVSSRGVSRPLTEAKHFRRNTGRLVELTTEQGKIIGRIAGSDADLVELTTETGPKQIALAAVTKAVVQVELNRLPADGEEEEA